jgi:co-chaperonin GroES (HSP10)
VSTLHVVENDPEAPDRGVVVSHGVRDVEDLNGQLILFNKYGGVYVKRGVHTLHLIEEARVLAILE